MNKPTPSVETAIRNAVERGLIKQLLQDGKISERAADNLLRAIK